MSTTANTYNDVIVRKLAVMTVVWGIVGMAVGVLIAAQLYWPALNFDIPWLTYSRLRPLHTNAVIFAFGYPPGADMTRAIGGEGLTDNQGVEVISGMAGPVENDRWMPAGNGVYQLVGSHSLVRHLLDPDTGIPRYVIYWTLTSPQTLVVTTHGFVTSADVTNQGEQALHSSIPQPRLGELKGHSVFRFTRVENPQAEDHAKQLRTEYNVGKRVDRRAVD